MSEAKNPLASKTIWGAILMVVSVILRQFDLELSDEDQSTLIDLGFAFADEIMAAIGVLLAVWGRFTAKKQVTITGKPAAMMLGLTALSSFLVLGSGGCSAGAPQASEKNLIETAGVDHLEYVEADENLPEDQKQTWRDRWRNFEELSQGDR